MQKIILILISLTSLLFFSGCASTGNQALSKISDQDINNTLIKGQTTKEQVRSIFGNPGTTSLMPDGTEHWVYTYARSVSKPINFVPYANLVYSGSNDSSKSLSILFDKNGRVINYSFSNSKGETKVGVFQ